MSIWAFTNVAKLALEIGFCCRELFILVNMSYTIEWWKSYYENIHRTFGKVRNKKASTSLQEGCGFESHFWCLKISLCSRAKKCSIVFCVVVLQLLVWSGYQLGMENSHGQWILVDTFFQNGWILMDIFWGWILVNTFGEFP